MSHDKDILNHFLIFFPHWDTHRDIEALSPKWDAFIKPLTLRLRDLWGRGGRKTVGVKGDRREFIFVFWIWMFCLHIFLCNGSLGTGIIANYHMGAGNWILSPRKAASVLDCHHSSPNYDSFYGFPGTIPVFFSLIAHSFSGAFQCTTQTI